jgi:hypothetical protein
MEASSHKQWLGKKVDARRVGLKWLDRSTTVWRGRRKSGKGRPRFRFQHKNPASTSRSLVQVICQTSVIQRMLEDGRQRDLYQQRVSAVDKRSLHQGYQKMEISQLWIHIAPFWGHRRAGTVEPNQPQPVPPTFPVRHTQALKARPSQSQSSDSSASWLCRGTTDSCFLHKKCSSKHSSFSRFDIFFLCTHAYYALNTRPFAQHN